MANERDINEQPAINGGNGPQPHNGMTQRQGGGFKINFNFYWFYMLIGLGLVGVYFFSGSSTTKSGEVGYSEFVRIAEQGNFEIIRVDNQEQTAHARIWKDSLTSVLNANPGLAKQYTQAKKKQVEFVVETNIPSGEKLSEDYDRWKTQAKEAGESFPTEIKWEKSSNTWHIIWSLASPILLLLFFFWIMSRGMGGAAGGIFNVGKSRARVYEKDKQTKVTFADVAGLSEAKTEVQEIVEFLKNPKKYTDLGGKIPKGALLVGPPGTGKTLLAKAVAGEANVPFMSMSGSDFVEMFVGVGASRVRDLFAQAKEKAPCIIFIDEIDAIGRARGTNARMSSNDERENTLNQLLTEMDGFGTNSGVIILAATNRADILDKALLRAGRFDRQIHVDLPELSDRIAIFKVHMKPLKLAKNFDLNKLARQTPGFSGADIANVCNEAALIAARNGKESVDIEDFNNAIDRIIGGLEKKSKVLTGEEKHSIAIHEAGHATISWHLQYAAPLVKVTIVPRGNALGAAWYMPEERQITTREQMNDELCSLLGGRAAEELFLGHISSGAANDLERVTKQCYAMVAYYGMSESLPNICYYDSSGQEYGFSKPYSEERAKIIDQEVSKMIAEQYARAKTILKQYAEGHDALTRVLEDREVIFTEDVEKIFGPRPWTSRQEVLLKDNGTEESGESREAGDSGNSEPASETEN